MTETRISVERIVRLGIPVAWQEAVEVARVAGGLSDARGIPLRASTTFISAIGTVELAWGAEDAPDTTVSMPQLLRLLLEGQHAPPELQAFLASADDALLGFPSEHDGAPTPRVNLYWFVGPNPGVPIARLARRALAAESTARPKKAPALQRAR